LSHGHLEISEAASLVAEAGFDALEISPWIPKKLTRTRVNSLERALRRNNLAFSGFTSLYPPEMTLASPSAAFRRKNILYTKRLIELAQSLDGKLLVWGSGRARSIPSGVPLRKGYAWLVELLRALGPTADQMHVKIAIEPLNRFESTIIHNVSEALSLAKLVNHRSVGVVYDTFHANLEEDSFTKPILLAGERLAAVHVSDCNRKIPGKGHIDFPPIFDALKKVRYDGYVTLEAILSRNPRQDLSTARKYLEHMID
jgi:sugar phosphate isomerase/epimerase